MLIYESLSHYPEACYANSAHNVGAPGIVKQCVHHVLIICKIYIREEMSSATMLTPQIVVLQFTVTENYLKQRSVTHNIISNRYRFCFSF